MWLKLAENKTKSNTAFICFWLPKDVRKTMDHIEDLDKDLHMTIVFIDSGVDTQEDRDAILESVEEVASQYHALKCKFEEIGMMKNGDNSLVANINVENGAELYTDLIRTIENKWKKFNRKYNFLPHCTLRIDNSEKIINLSELRKYEWKANELSVQFSMGGEKYIYKMNSE